tara:strand:+ start:64 stop:891 length:828 start_codon:yes stop_codon:yes gene_type:complete
MATTKDIPIALSDKYITQVTTDTGRRRYEIDGVKFPSVTKIIDNTLRNFGIESWKATWINDQMEHYRGRKLTETVSSSIVNRSRREADDSAWLGSRMHQIIEGLLKDEEVDSLITDQLEPAVRAWLKWRQHFLNWELVGTEVGVYYDSPNGWDRYAGQVDAVFKNGMEYMVVDWKTTSGIYPDHYMQVSAYAHALQEMYKHGYGVTKVTACLVRMDNYYPTIKKNDKDIKDRRQPKIFSGSLDYTEPKVEQWYELFEKVLYINKSMNNREHVTVL